MKLKKDDFQMIQKNYNNSNYCLNRCFMRFCNSFSLSCNLQGRDQLQFMTGWKEQEYVRSNSSSAKMKIILKFVYGPMIHDINCGP